MSRTIGHGSDVFCHGLERASSWVTDARTLLITNYLNVNYTLEPYFTYNRSNVKVKDFTVKGS